MCLIKAHDRKKNDRIPVQKKKERPHHELLNDFNFLYVHAKFFLMSKLLEVRKGPFM